MAESIPLFPDEKTIAVAVIRLSKRELCALVAKTTTELTAFAEGSPEHGNALETLRLPHFVLARSDVSP